MLQLMIQEIAAALKVHADIQCKPGRAKAVMKHAQSRLQILAPSSDLEAQMASQPVIEYGEGPLEPALCRR